MTRNTPDDIEAIIERLQAIGAAVIEIPDGFGFHPVKVAAKKAGIPLRSSANERYPRWVRQTIGGHPRPIPFNTTVVLWDGAKDRCEHCGQYLPKKLRQAAA